MSEDLRKLAEKVINKDKWWDILSRFIDVLRINIFIVDFQGGIILPPDKEKYGGRFLTDSTLGFDLLQDSKDLMKKFHPYGKYLESENRYGLHSFAIPIVVTQKTIAYMIVGPTILNRRLDRNIYEEFAQKLKISPTTIIDEINTIRIVSNMMMNSILDLLSEIVRDNVELSLREVQKTTQRVEPALSKDLNRVAQEIYSSVRMDELLATLLDVAIKMTNTEAGSIMVIDDKKGDLTIKVSRGIDKKRAELTRIKVGEGIAGLAAKENRTFILRSSDDADNRISHLLKRPEIKHSLIMPLTSKDNVFGVLNLHTTRSETAIDDNFENLQYLTKLLSFAF